MNKLKLIGTAVVIAAVAFSCGKYASSTEVKEVEKIVYVERTTTKSDTKRVVNKKETVKPDGSKVVETVTTTERKTDKTSDVSQESEKTSISKDLRPNWQFSVGYSIEHRVEPAYSVEIKRRMFSEVYIGALYLTEPKTGFITIGIGI